MADFKQPYVARNGLTSKGATRIEDTSALLLPKGTTAQRPGAAEDGYIRLNTETGKFEKYLSGGWVNDLTTADVAAAIGAMTNTASATSITLPTTGMYANITGSGGVTTTSFANGVVGRKVGLLYTGSGNWILQNNSSLVIPGSADITLTTGDYIELTQVTASVWRLTHIQYNASLPMFTADMQAFIGKGTDIAFAATISLPARGVFCDVTGTGGTTTLINGSWLGRTVSLRYAGSGSWILQNNSNLELGANDLTLVNGDRVVLINRTGNVWSLIAVQRGDGSLIVEAAARTRPVVVTSGGTVTIDASKSNVFYVSTLNQNVTAFTINNPTDGQTINVRFIQDSTAGRTVAAVSGSKINGSIDPTALTASWWCATYMAYSVNRWEGSWQRIPT